MSAQIILPGGNVGREIEHFSFGQGGEGIKFDVCVTDMQRGEEVKRWYKVACFGRVTQQAQQLINDGKLVTGAKVMVMGAFNPRDYTTRNGENRTSFDVTASVIEVLSWPKPQPQQQQYMGDDEYNPGYDLDNYDDLPNF